MNLNDGIAARRTGSIALLTAAVMLFSFAVALRHPVSSACGSCGITSPQQ
jgi:hypothetical protein